MIENKKVKNWVPCSLLAVDMSWKSKGQATIEISVFGVEFVAMKQGIEAVHASDTSFE